MHSSTEHTSKINSIPPQFSLRKIVNDSGNPSAFLMGGDCFWQWNTRVRPSFGKGGLNDGGGFPGSEGTSPKLGITIHLLIILAMRSAMVVLALRRPAFCKSAARRFAQNRFARIVLQSLVFQVPTLFGNVRQKGGFPDSGAAIFGAKWGVSRETWQGLPSRRLSTLCVCRFDQVQ